MPSPSISFHSIRFYSIPFVIFVPFHLMLAVPFQSIPFHLFLSDSILSYFIPFRSILQHSLHFHLIHPIPFHSTPYRSLSPSIHSLLSIHSCVQVSMLLILILPSMLSFFILRSHSCTIPSIRFIHASNSHASIHPFCFILSDFIILHSMLFHANPCQSMFIYFFFIPSVLLLFFISSIHTCR